MVFEGDADVACLQVDGGCAGSGPVAVGDYRVVVDFGDGPSVWADWFTVGENRTVRIRCVKKYKSCKKMKS